MILLLSDKIKKYDTRKIDGTKQIRYPFFIRLYFNGDTPIILVNKREK